MAPGSGTSGDPWRESLKAPLHATKRKDFDMKKNLGTAERVVRVALGGGAALWALVQLLSAGTLGWQIAYVAIIALGADFVFTGIRGYCPLYNQLGWNTAGADSHG
jgi:hypothetical protein